MAITNKQRLDLIESYIRRHRYADLHTLAEKFKISLSTVRRALNDLESSGIIRRHHGGASLLETADSGGGGYDFITQDDQHAEQKRAIARHLANVIQPGMTVILDGGTTTYALARQLVEKRLVVITNSLPIAALFSEVGSCETIATGGIVYSRLGILYGPTCEQSLSEVHADIAVCGAAGVTSQGLWNTNHFVISLQKHMRQASDRVFFAVDSSKLGKQALHLSCGLSPDFTLVTDRQPPAELARALRNAGTAVSVANTR